MIELPISTTTSQGFTRTTIELTEKQVIEALIKYVQECGYFSPTPITRRFIWYPHQSSNSSNLTLVFDKEHEVTQQAKASLVAKMPKGE